MTQRRNRTRNKQRRLEAVEETVQDGPIATPMIEKLFIEPGDNVDLSTAEGTELYQAGRELTALMVMALGDLGAAAQSVYNGLAMLSALNDEVMGRLIVPAEEPSES